MRLFGSYTSTSWRKSVIIIQEVRHIKPLKSFIEQLSFKMVKGLGSIISRLGFQLQLKGRKHD